MRLLMAGAIGDFGHACGGLDRPDVVPGAKICGGLDLVNAFSNTAQDNREISIGFRPCAQARRRCYRCQGWPAVKSFELGAMNICYFSWHRIITQFELSRRWVCDFRNRVKADHQEIPNSRGK